MPNTIDSNMGGHEGNHKVFVIKSPHERNREMNQRMASDEEEPQ